MSTIIHQLPKIQIVSRCLPAKNIVGHYTYLLDLMSYLRRAGCMLELVVLDQWLQDVDIPPEVRKIADVYIKKSPLANHASAGFRILLIKLRTFSRSYLPEWCLHLLRKGKQWLRGNSSSNAPKTWDALLTKAEGDFAKIRFAEFNPNVVIANYVFLSSILDTFSHNNHVLKVILTYDIRHQRVEDYKKVGYPSCDSNWNWENESELLRKADVLLAIQENDAKMLKEMAPHSEVFCLPMSGRLSSNPSTVQVPGRCLFVGSNVDHNVYGLQWFLKEVWAIILRRLPYCNLHVCGTVNEKFSEEFPSVNFLGRVAQLEPEYAATEVCLVPLVVGSGLKIKLVEALSHGRACISTSVGVQGIQEIANRAVLVADTPEDFAEAVVTILNNPEKRRKMEEQARKYVEDELSPEKIYQPFVDRIYQHIYQQNNWQ